MGYQKNEISGGRGLRKSRWLPILTVLTVRAGVQKIHQFVSGSKAFRSNQYASSCQPAGGHNHIVIKYFRLERATSTPRPVIHAETQKAARVAA
jgi:hypothetical protein